MPYSNITFVKVQMELLEDDRFLFDLTDAQKGLYLMLLALAGKTNNHIRNEIHFIKSRLNLSSLNMADIERVSVVFPKLRCSNGYWSFDNFEETHNYIMAKYRKSKGTPKERQRLEQNKNKNKKEKENEKEKENHTSVGTAKVEIQEVWNSMPRLRRIIEWSDVRLNKLRARIKEPEFVNGWRTCIQKLNDSSFATSGSWLSIDWLLDNGNNYLKVLEGKYDDTKTDKYLKPVGYRR